MTAPLYLVASGVLPATAVVLDGDEGRHAADVRRIRVGEAVDVTDGQGVVGHGVVSAVARGRVSVAVSAVESVVAPALRFVVAQALAKGGRDEDAVEAMTEVGVDEIWAWTAGRSVARWSDRTLLRWQAAARAATKQSHRAWLPSVSGPVSTADLAERLRLADVALVLHEAAEAPLADVELPAAGEVVVVVGPEGGIADDEVALLAAAGASVVRLGSNVLRTSTAGVAALSVLSVVARWR